MKNIILFFSFLAASQISAQATLPPEMVFVQGGTFTMGCTPEQQPCDNYNNPVHFVRIPSFWVSRFEITQAQWQTVMGNNPSNTYGVGSNYPVYFVNYFDCARFCNKLSLSQGLEPCYYSDKNNVQLFDTIAGGCNLEAFNISVFLSIKANGYRMLTEAEWEYVSRGGNSVIQTIFSGSNNPDSVGWYVNNSAGGSHLVDSKKPNALNVFNMSGNLNEWCFDLGDTNNGIGYGELPPVCLYPIANIIRGGSWSNGIELLKVSYRQSVTPWYKCVNTTCRVARNAD